MNFNTSLPRELPVTAEQAANIRALIAIRNRTAAEIAAIYPSTQNGTRVVRVDFAVERDLTDRETTIIRCALVTDAIIPAARALSMRLQCGVIEASAPVAA